MVTKNQWNQGCLSDVIESLVAGISVNSGEQDSPSNFFILRTSAISKGKLDISEKKPVLAQEVVRLKCSLRKDTILISRMNTPELVGECAYVAYDDNRIYLPDRIWQTNFKKNICVNAKWLNYLLSSSKYRLLIQSCATGTSYSMKNISKEQLLSLEILYPSFQEQTAIAETLSDVDSLIASLQKLIEKKKAIKQGAMQELLTGKRRLPGFNGEWKRERLGNISDIKDGTHGTFQRVDRGYPLLSAKNVYNNHLNIAENESLVSSEDYHSIIANGFPRKDDILLSCVGTIGRCCIFSGTPKVAFQRSVAFIRLKDYDTRYILQYMQSENANKQLFSSANASAQAGVYLGAISDVEVYVPCCLKEQQAIAQVLFDMDSEIEQLEKELAKYQQIKQGMMQELLTGRIRLVDVEDNEQPKTQKVQEKQPHPAHNQHFDDAVMIAGIVNAFYSEKYPLGRKKVQKLLYLVRRKEQADISAFHKKAAGPYADEVRYKGGEPIAQKNRYIQIKRSDKGSCFEKGTQMQQALSYLQDWGKQADITWLVSQFQYTGVNELELLATVDMAMCDLRLTGKEISVTSIKDLIRSNKEWKNKLEKAYFSDTDIQHAIIRCLELFRK